MKEEKKTKEDYGMTGEMLWLHARALSAHCECLGMNAENMWAAIANHPPVYLSSHYQKMMEKYGLVDEEGNSII